MEVLAQVRGGAEPAVGGDGVDGLRRGLQCDAGRVDAARAALETTRASVDDIAAQCGFGTAANLRKHFHRHVDVTPTAYRRAFSRA